MNVSSLFVDLAGWGYALAAFGYLLLAGLLLTSWKGRVQGAFLLSIAISSAIWAVWVSYAFFNDIPATIFHIWLELLKDGCVLLFLYKLLSNMPHITQGRYLKSFALFTLILWLALLVGHTYLSIQVGTFQLVAYSPLIVGHTIIMILGLIFIEQLLRNTHPQERWAVKYLCLGLGGIFAYDFYMYSSGVLFGGLDVRYWDARGFIHILVIPLILVSAARNPQWSLDVFVSRKVVFHSAAVLSAGIYLLVMALGGYAIQYWGESWGGVVQTIFLFAAALVLVSLLFSGQVRAYFKVFLSKHFYSYKYDYRVEWLRLINDLEIARLQGENIGEQGVRTLANIVDSPGGMLWLANKGGGGYIPVNGWNPNHESHVLSRDFFTSFLEDSQWIVDLEEFRDIPEVYGELKLPKWLEDIDNAWLVIPLFQNKCLFGIVILLQSRVSRNINWEDRDLLKTAASQVSSYLALSEASTELAEARQFEAFNRLSAYVVHDLKNVVGQLSLVVSNSKKFSNNPAFVEDAFATVDNSVLRMQKMLAQLRQGRMVGKTATAINLIPILELVRNRCSMMKPYPAMDLPVDAASVKIVADADQLESVIEHIVQNAQEATPDDGNVQIRLLLDKEGVIIEIEDNGCGMPSSFVKNRLFKPFDTTKGNAGMGIGVYESREFIRTLGGEVTVKSEIGKGSVFRFYIPKHPL